MAGAAGRVTPFWGSPTHHPACAGVAPHSWVLAVFPRAMPLRKKQGYPLGVFPILTPQYPFIQVHPLSDGDCFHTLSGTGNPS